MTTFSPTLPRSGKAPWLLLIALGGIAWNGFGLVQLAGSVSATPADLVAGGMTPAQAAVMAAYPAWMTLAFAVGALGGLVGSALLLLRSSFATPVLAASLAGYVALWIGDLVHGVFAAMGAPQVIVLTAVVAIAAALTAASRFAASTRS